MSKVILGFSKYTSDANSKLEVEKLFKKFWLFGCFTDEVSLNKDFIVKKFPFGEVVIRNFDGEIKAFFNICPHRFSKLFLKEQGNSIIECPYHGWRYDNKGTASAIPFKRDCFGAEFRQENYQLKFLRCEIVGKFIFIKIDTNQEDISLKDFLGDSYVYLLEVSEKMAARIDRNEMLIRSNWKLVIENSLEDYHLGKVHPETLAKLLSSKYTSSFTPFTSTTRIDLLDSNVAKIKKLGSFFQDRLEVEGYKHVFIFPNLAIATTEGLSFFVQEAIPLGTCETKYVSFGYLSKFKDNLVNLIKDQLSEQFKETNRQVFKEDAEICEGIQDAMMSPVEFQGVLGMREDRIKHFQELYLKYLEL